MMSDSDDDAPGAYGKGGSRHGSRESLTDALDDLENMLDRHQGPGVNEVAGPREASVADDGQYSIPLLNDVVLPPARPVSDAAHRRTPLADDYEEAAERMAERLSSEIDVIVQSAVEEAVDLLRRDIGERIREHLDITLPEILEELVQQRQER